MYSKPNRLLRVVALLAGTVVLSSLYACKSPFRVEHELDISRKGFRFDNNTIDTTALRDSLKPFCSERKQRHIWKLASSDTSLKSADFVEFLSFISGVSQDCRGLFALGEAEVPLLMQPPVPAPRSIYNLSIHVDDSVHPRISLMVVAQRDKIRMMSQEGWLPEIPVVADTKGMDWVASEKPGSYRIGWHDIYGRCAVDIRGDHCTDSLWAKSKYVMLGNLVRLPDTIHTDNPKDMEWLARGPLSRDIAMAAEIHALRTIPGALPDNKVYNHAVYAPDLSWESTIRLIIGLRQAGVDFNTVEILK